MPLTFKSCFNINHNKNVRIFLSLAIDGGQNAAYGVVFNRDLTTESQKARGDRWRYTFPRGYTSPGGRGLHPPQGNRARRQTSLDRPPKRLGLNTPK